MVSILLIAGLVICLRELKEVFDILIADGWEFGTAELLMSLVILVCSYLISFNIGKSIFT